MNRESNELPDIAGVLAKETGWKERIRNNQLWVGWDVKPQKYQKHGNTLSNFCTMAHRCFDGLV